MKCITYFIHASQFLFQVVEKMLENIIMCTDPSVAVVTFFYAYGVCSTFPTDIFKLCFLAFKRRAKDLS